MLCVLATRGMAWLTIHTHLLAEHAYKPTLTLVASTFGAKFSACTWIYVVS